MEPWREHVSVDGERALKIVEIEATNLCNASCLMCPRDKLTRSTGRMSWETFQEIADRILAFGQTQLVNFSGIGEPLINPHLARFVAYVSPHARTYLTTNGSLLSESAIDALLEAGLHQLTLSFNGAGAEEYEHIMVNLDYGRTQAVVRRLVSMADGRLALRANVIASNLTRHPLSAIRKHLNDMGIDQIIYSLCHSRGGSFHDSTVCSNPPPPPTSRCDIFGDTTFVAWDGKVLACCQDVAGVAVLGDLTQMSMQQLAAKRATILESGVDFPMCPQCDDIYRFYHDEPPPGATLSEWIYHLYESKDSRTAILTQALRQTQDQLAGVLEDLAALEGENVRLQQVVAGYEQGRFIRLMRWLHEQRSRLGR